MELYKNLSGTFVTHIPYRGGGPALNDTVAGQVNMIFDNLPSALPFIQQMRLIPIVVAAPTRLAVLPDVPTFKELGVNWVDGAFRGIGVPKSASPEQRKKLADLYAALNTEPEMQQLAAKAGFELVNVDLAQMDAFMKERSKVYTDRKSVV